MIGGSRGPQRGTRPQNMLLRHTQKHGDDWLPFLSEVIRNALPEKLMITEFLSFQTTYSEVQWWYFTLHCFCVCLFAFLFYITCYANDCKYCVRQKLLCKGPYENVNKPHTIKCETNLHWWKLLCFLLDKVHVTDAELWALGEPGSGQSLPTLHAFYFSRRTLTVFVLAFI
jgi:hypothetical protein